MTSGESYRRDAAAPDPTRLAQVSALVITHHSEVSERTNPESIDVAGLPERQAIVEITMRHEREHRCWLVLERGTSPYGCFEDPLLDESRYVYVEAGITVLLALARGRRSWADAVADGSVAAFGNPDLIRQIPFWFKSVEQSRSEIVPDRPASTVAEATPPA